MSGVRRYAKAAIALAVLAVVALPTAWHGWPDTAVGNAETALIVAAGLTLVAWREHPRAVTVGGGALWLAACAGIRPGLLDGFWFPDPALSIMALLATVAALAWTGRAARVAAVVLAGYLAVLCWVAYPTSAVGLLMFSVPGFLAGTVLRQRSEAAEALAERGRELEEERELFADLALRHERARIAAELHDIVGHAVSVMVIQAAAAQRLVGHDPERAGQALAAIADSARQGQEDLQRLVALLGGTPVGGSDLALIEEVVTRAARSGLDVSCRFEGDRDGVAAPTAHLAFRVVQESLTNALRHAPGAAVRVVVGGSGRDVVVDVENDRPAGERPALVGTGRGLTGLRERVQGHGGRLSAGPTAAGGWCVRATLP